MFSSQAIVVGNTMYLSGSIGVDPESGKLVPGGVKQEAHQVQV